ncbi:MAG: hypothetical protein IKT80_07750, partial [Bacteroidaceae bacterium]|nr:hypothetical protein [Bacteroidaceae bacterium]
LQEEQTLKEYFLNADNVPAKWNSAKAMFTGFCSNKEVTSRTVTVKKKGMPLKRIAAAVAVVALLSVSVALFVPKEKEIYCYVNGKPVTDYELALKHAERAFGIMEKEISKPAQSLDLIEKEVEKSTIYIDLLKQLQ